MQGAQNNEKNLLLT